MAGTIYTWFGGSGLGNDNSDWSPTGHPNTGDTAIVNAGTVTLGVDDTLNANTVYFGSATFNLIGDFGGNTATAISLSNPTFDPATVIRSAATGISTGTINATGITANDGTILSNGSAGSSLLIAIGAALSNGTLVPGYFFNAGTIEATAGNTVIIDVGPNSELFNSGSIIADGGTVKITASPSAIAGGIAAEAAFFVIENGGTLETQASYPLINGSQPGGDTPRYEFANATPGNTLKIDNLGSFSGSVIGFQAGDTVDLGTSLAVGTLVYSTATSLLVLENTAGTILDSLYLTADAMTSGTFAVSGITADGIVITTGADGDTLLTTSRTLPQTSGVSGTWQNALSWNNGIIPGPLDSAVIGLGETTTFTLTTGATPVAVNGISLYDPNATLDVTSNTNITPGIANVYAGTLDVFAGNTLTASGLRSFAPTGSILIQAGGTVDLTGRPNSNLAAIAGTLALSQGNTSAVQFTAGTLVVDGALLAGPTPTSNGGGFTIGEDSSGTPASVIVNGDGKATDGQVTDTYALLGSDPTSSGTLTLNGPGASWTDTIDPNDPLNSRGDIVVGYNNLSSNSGTLAQPGPIAPAQVVIENGATLTDQDYGTIGSSINSAGAVTVTTGGLWNVAVNGVGYINVGLAGSGTLDVLNGGSVAIGAVGTFLNNGTSTIDGGIGIGQSIGATGTVLVSGNGSRISMLYGITVGRSGQGLLDILNGGTVLVNGGGMIVGQTAAAGASGTVVVGGTGTASFLDFGAANTIMAIGDRTQGTLIVADNGTINLNASTVLTLGAIAGSFGTAFVGGTTAAAVINIDTSGMAVGNSGTGFLTVGTLGTIAMTGTGGLSVGSSAGGAGTLTINGGLITQGAAVNGVGLGNSSGANGSILIENAGTLALGGNWLTAGIASGASGTVSVTGPGSTLKTTGTAGLTIGDAGTGILTVSNGAFVSDISGLSIALDGGDNGRVAVTGGTLAAASIFVGQSGNGTLAVTGGTVTATGLLDIGFTIGSSGSVTVSGLGTKLSANGGIEVGVAGSGTLAIQGATVTTGNLSLAGSSTAPLGTSPDLATLTSGAVIDVAGSLAIWHGATLALDSTSGIDVGTSGSVLAGGINLETGHTLIGNGLIAAAILNNGLIETVGSTAPNGFGQGGLVIQGPVTGTGAIAIADNGIVQFDTAIATTQAIQFAPNSAGELILNDPGTSFGNAITGLTIGDKIEFGGGITITSATVVAGDIISISFDGTNGVPATYNLTDVGFAAGVTPLLGWGTDFSTGDAFVQLDPPNANWQGGFGTGYGTASNWQGGLVPNAATSVNFTTNPGTITGTGSALSLTIGNYNVFNPGPWTFQGATLTVAGAPSPPFIPFAVAFNANTVLNGGTLNAAGGSVGIDNTSGVIVTAENGAQVTTAGDSIGTNNDQSGTLDLTGSGTDWTDQTGPAVNGNQPGYTHVGFGSGSAGYLTVTDDATLNTGGYANVAGGTGSFGTATVSAGGIWTIGQGLQVGGGGTGTLAISGGTVTATGYNDIGGSTGAEGTVAISSGIFNAGTNLTVGAAGVGTLVATGGTVTTGQLTLGSVLGGVGLLSLTNGSITAASGMQIGSSGGGVATVGAGGTLKFGGTYNPIGGNPGSSGTLLILNGGTAQATQAPGTAQVLQIGNSAATNTTGAADGTVVVSGAGSLLNLDTNGMNVGNQGVGILTVADGGVVDAGVTNSNLGSALTAANTTGGIAAITVTGTGSALNLAGYASLGQGGQATLNVNDDGLVNITNANTNGTGLSLGAGFSTPTSTTGQAEATVTTGGTLADAGSITIGGNGASGVLNVNNGGVVKTVTGLTVGTATEVNGTIYGGTGSLNIGAGGTVAVTEASQSAGAAVVIGGDNSTAGQSTGNAEGDVVVSGSGALLNTNNNPLEVGRSSLGNLTVSQGGSVSVGTPNSNGNGALYVGRYSAGNVVLTDPGSELTATGYSVIGRAGSGSLVIENRATMIVDNDPTGAGSIAIGAGQGTANTVQVSSQTGGSGDAQVTTGGDLFSQQDVFIGRFGADGSLEINSGGTVEASQQVVIGQSQTVAAGGTLITATGTTIAASAVLLAGEGVINVGAGGLLKADGAGITTTGTSDIQIGADIGASGALNVTGVGATVNTGGYRIGVGIAGQGSLLISQGGTVLAGTPFAGDDAIYAGGSVGATGAVTITDPGSELLSDGEFSVGLGGTGNLLIENRATAVTGGNAVDPNEGFDVGTDAGADGAATISNALLSNTGRFIVGDAGLGSLSITAGGTVTTTASATIANAAGSDGSAINVTGAGSALQIGGALDVGAAATGELAITAGATVTAATIDAGIAASGAGIVTVSGTGADLVTTGSVSVGDAGSGELAILDGANATIAGDLNIANAGTGTGNVDIEDTTGTITFGGNIYVGFNGFGVLNIGVGVTYIQSSGGIIFGPDSSGSIGSFADPSPDLINTSANPIGLPAQGIDQLAAYLFNSGEYTIPNSHTLTFDTPLISGGGSFALGSNDHLTLNTGTVSGQTFSLGTADTLTIGADALQTIDTPNSGLGPFTPVANPNFGTPSIGGFAGVVANFTAGNTIVVQTDGAATFGLNGSVVSVIENGTTLGSIAFDTVANATTAIDTAGALVDQVVQHCFLPDTLIATPGGEVKVQHLRAGDVVRTAAGAERPVVWIGEGRVLAPRGRRSAATPVIVRRGALGPNVPHYDLHVTKGHALFIDGVLIPVEFLVNHRSILWDDQAREVSLYHVELDAHDVLLANGAPAESYRDDGNRWLFANANSGWGLPEKPPCAPVLTGGPVVDTVWQRLLERAGSRPGLPLTDDPDVHLLMDGVRVDGARSGDRCVFRLRSGAAAVRLVSRAASPAELGLARDPRVLGVAVRRVEVWQGPRVSVIDADDSRLSDGFHGYEPDGGIRWTDGDAELPVGAMSGEVELVVHLGGATRYAEWGEAA